MTNKPVTFNIGANLGDIYNFTDKKKSIADYVAYMLARSQSMFEYKNLPETIPERDLILMLQTHGYVCLPDPSLTDGKPYALWGGLGGEPNPYYMPTKCVVANPALKLEKEFTINEDCVIVPHDSMYMGLLPLYSRYATQLAENDISIDLAQVNSRIINIISATDDKTYKSALQFLDDIRTGKIGAIGENAFLQGLKVHENSRGHSGTITELIELHQYLRAGWFNDIGLNANYNMKRESINSNEAQLNDDALLPFIDDIYRTQKTAFDKYNEKYGYNIQIEYGSAWANNQEQSIQMESEVVNDESQADNHEPD